MAYHEIVVTRESLYIWSYIYLDTCGDSSHLCWQHSDEVEDDEEENIDVEGDSEVYGEYEWAGRHLIRATTFLVGGFAGTFHSNWRCLRPDLGRHHPLCNASLWSDLEMHRILIGMIISLFIRPKKTGFRILSTKKIYDDVHNNHTA